MEKQRTQKTWTNKCMQFVQIPAQLDSRSSQEIYLLFNSSIVSSDDTEERKKNFPNWFFIRKAWLCNNNSHKN